MKQHSDPLDKLVSLEWLFDWDNPKVKLGFPLLFHCVSMASHSSEFKKIFQEWIERAIEPLQAALQEGVDAGRFRVDDVQVTARTVSAIIHGIGMRWYLDPEVHSTEWALESVGAAISGLLDIR